MNRGDRRKPILTDDHDRHLGEDIRQSAQAKAERIVREELEALGWSVEELRRRRNGHAAKVRIAACLEARDDHELWNCSVNWGSVLARGPWQRTGAKPLGIATR